MGSNSSSGQPIAYAVAFGSFFLFNQGFSEAAETLLPSNHTSWVFPLSEEEQTALQSFLDALITNRIDGLLSYRDKLMRINPISMAQFICSDPMIRQKVECLLVDETKFYFLTFALEMQFNRMAREGVLGECISSIASILELDPVILSDLIQQKNYKDFIRWLLALE